MIRTDFLTAMTTVSDTVNISIGPASIVTAQTLMNVACTETAYISQVFVPNFLITDMTVCLRFHLRTSPPITAIGLLHYRLVSLPWGKTRRLKQDTSFNCVVPQPLLFACLINIEQVYTIAMTNSEYVILFIPWKNFPLSSLRAIRI